MPGYLEKGFQTPVAQGRSTRIISMIEWTRTSRLSIKISLTSCRQGLHHRHRAAHRSPQYKTRNPKPETRNSKPETGHSKPGTRNLNPELRYFMEASKTTDFASQSFNTVRSGFAVWSFTFWVLPFGFAVPGLAFRVCRFELSVLG